MLVVTALNAFLIYWICKKNVSWFGLRNPTKTQVKKFFGSVFGFFTGHLYEVNFIDGNFVDRIFDFI